MYAESQPGHWAEFIMSIPQPLEAASYESEAPPKQDSLAYVSE